jgi:hypothetical protein
MSEIAEKLNNGSPGYFVILSTSSFEYICVFEPICENASLILNLVVDVVFYLPSQTMKMVNRFGRYTYPIMSTEALTGLFTSIANAIRSKSGTSSSLMPK